MSGPGHGLMPEWRPTIGVMKTPVRRSDSNVDAASTARDGSRHPEPVGRRARLGAAGIVIAIATFLVAVAVSVGVTGSAYVWQVNMISDLGDSACRVRDGRWICSPGFALFNAGMIVTGVLLAVAGGCLLRLWGRALGGGLTVMGVGLVVAGAYPAGDFGRMHLIGVVLALVVPGVGMLLSAIDPETPWLRSRRVARGLLGAVALAFCADSRLPQPFLPRGAGEVVIVGCLLLALIIEAWCVLSSRRR